MSRGPTWRRNSGRSISSGALQRRTSARGAAGRNAEFALSQLAAAVSDGGTGDRVSRPLPRAGDHGGRYVPLRDKLLFLSNALKHYPIGLEEIADGLWSVYFSHVLLARIDERTGTLIRG